MSHETQGLVAPDKMQRAYGKFNYRQRREDSYRERLQAAELADETGSNKKGTAQYLADCESSLRHETANVHLKTRALALCMYAVCTFSNILIRTSIPPFRESSSHRDVQVDPLVPPSIHLRITFIFYTTKRRSLPNKALRHCYHGPI